jgi:two-component system response regulator QseB
MLPLVLVEDNTRLAGAISRGLREDGFDVLCAETGAAGLRCLSDRPVAAVILDLGLPDVDGLTILRQARQDGFIAPILVLTARDAIQSRVEGLEAGADDYLVKPFAYPELLARVRALVRRAETPRRQTQSFADLVLSSDVMQVSVAGRSIALSPRQHALLELLVQRRGAVIGRLEILREVFGYNFDPGTNIVDVHVAHLRRKLGSAAVLVQTVRGVGYRLRPSEADEQ